ncbi:MAG: efflux RND transporter permease subunit [Arenimonas sp.]|nr:efflux RND transporter permease subunit [Arenimonas sp.]MBP6309055.1 efflux RND transporter permease subunit [Arenimonas sp.]
MSLVELSLKRPVTVTMFFISMVVIGLIASVRLPLEQFPEVNFPFMGVSVPYPGSTPQEVERSITRPIEEALATLPGIKEINSTSRADAAEFQVQFSDFDRDVAISANEARSRIDAIRKDLPADMQRYFVQRFSPSDQPFLELRFASSRDLRYEYEMIERLFKRRIERIPGVAAVEISGSSPSEIEIALNPTSLGAYSISLNQLATKLQAVNFSVSAGQIDDGARRLRVQPVGEIRDLDELRNLVLNESGLRLSDIAQVRFKTQREEVWRRLDLKPAVGINIRRERSANLVDVSKLVMAELELINQEPELIGIKSIVIGNQAESVQRSIKELVEAGIIGSLLSLFVLYFFLRHWPSTLMVTLAIPICIIMTLGAMYFLGITLNVLSMMGLLLGLGMLVDNAVVVVESIYQYREKYPNDPVRCAIEGTRSVQIAITAGTFTSIVVFLPNLFGEANMISIFLGQVALTITISLLCSWLVAVSLIPMISAHLRTPPMIGRSNGFIPRLVERYGRLLRWSLEHRFKSLAAILAIVLVSFVPMKFTEFDFFKNEASPKLDLYFDWKGAYSAEQMSEEVFKIEKFLDQRRERYQLTQIYVYFGERGFGGVKLDLRKDGPGLKTPAEISEMLRTELPKSARAEIGFEGGGGGGGGTSAGDQKVTFFLNGDSPEKLMQIGNELLPSLEKRPELTDVRVNSGDENNEVRVSVDRERAATFGFSAQEVAQYLGIALRGSPLREFRRGNTEVPVWVRFEGSEKFSMDRLSSLDLTRADGVKVPLLSLVDVQIKPGASQISRNNRQTSIAIDANINRVDKFDKDAARKAINEVMNAAKLNETHPGYSWGEGSGFRGDDEAQQQMLFNLGIAMLMIFIVMAALFESMLFPLAIFSSIIFSILGIFWLFALTGTTFTVMAFIGVLVLMGVVVNNGIVMLDHINLQRRNGLSRTDALIQGSKERLRPILMTMGTAILGMLPLCFGGSGIGGDGPSYAPMARAVVGGLAFSTIVSLLFLPTIYAMLDDVSQYVSSYIKTGREKAPVLSKFIESAN